MRLSQLRRSSIHCPCNLFVCSKSLRRRFPCGADRVTLIRPYGWPYSEYQKFHDPFFIPKQVKIAHMVVSPLLSRHGSINGFVNGWTILSAESWKQLCEVVKHSSWAIEILVVFLKNSNINTNGIVAGNEWKPSVGTTDRPVYHFHLACSWLVKWV